MIRDRSAISQHLWYIYIDLFVLIKIKSFSNLCIHPGLHLLHYRIFDPHHSNCHNKHNNPAFHVYKFLQNCSLKVKEKLNKMYCTLFLYSQTNDIRYTCNDTKWRQNIVIVVIILLYLEICLDEYFVLFSGNNK